MYLTDLEYVAGINDTAASETWRCNCWNQHRYVGPSSSGACGYHVRTLARRHIRRCPLWVWSSWTEQRCGLCQEFHVLYKTCHEVHIIIATFNNNYFFNHNLIFLPLTFRSLPEIFVRRSLFTSSSSGSCHGSDVTWQENGRTYGSVCSSPRHGWQIVVPPYGCGLPLWSIWCLCLLFCFQSVILLQCSLFCPGAGQRIQSNDRQWVKLCEWCLGFLRCCFNCLISVFAVRTCAVDKFFIDIRLNRKSQFLFFE